jgi:hypothetical protein
MLVLANGRGESFKELLHRFGVGVGQDEGETVVRAGLNASEDVGEREALVAQAQGALAALPPDMAGSTLLTYPCLVLEKQPDALVFMRSLKFFE